MLTKVRTLSSAHPAPMYHSSLQNDYQPVTYRESIEHSYFLIAIFELSMQRLPGRSFYRYYYLLLSVHTSRTPPLKLSAAIVNSTVFITCQAAHTALCIKALSNAEEDSVPVVPVSRAWQPPGDMIQYGQCKEATEGTDQSRNSDPPSSNPLAQYAGHFSAILPMPTQCSFGVHLRAGPS